MTRTQIFALASGVWQLTAALLDVPLVNGAHPVLQAGAGLLGIVLARRHHLARLYGLGLVLLTGALPGADTLRALLADEPLWLLRTAAIGATIALVPARTARTARSTDRSERVH